MTSTNHCEQYHSEIELQQDSHTLSGSMYAQVTHGLPFAIGSMTPATLLAGLPDAAARSLQPTAAAGSPVADPICRSPVADSQFQIPRWDLQLGVLQLGFCNWGFAPQTGELPGHNLPLQLLAQPSPRAGQPMLHSVISLHT